MDLAREDVGAELSPCTRATEGSQGSPPEDSLTCAPPSPPGNPPRPSQEPEEPRRPAPAPAERSSGSGTPKLIQRALLRGTALLASLGLGRDLQPPGGPSRDRGEPQQMASTPQPTLSPVQPPSPLPSRLARFSKTSSTPTSRLSPSPSNPAPLLLDLGVPAGQPSAKSPRREEERRGEWTFAGLMLGEGGGSRARPTGPRPSAGPRSRLRGTHERD